MSTEKKTLRIGVLYEEVQMTDLVGLDILGNMSVKIMTMIADLIPAVKDLLHQAVPMEFLYIASTLEHTWMSPDIYVRPTHTYEDAPRDLDLLLLGGPNPMTVPEASLKFIREAAKETKVILSTCTGGMWLARSGILDGKQATTNRMLLESAKQYFPNIDWQDQRWVIEDGLHADGKIWTAGGAGCGIDMIVEYSKQNFGKEALEVACKGLDFDTTGKGQFYKTGESLL